MVVWLTHTMSGRVLPLSAKAGLFCFVLFFSALSSARAADVDDVDTLPRHPLEVKALTMPEVVLAELPKEIELAQKNADAGLLALLYLAQANACRVMADWTCQRRAGSSARIAAEQVDDLILQVRGLIAESRGSIAQRDYLWGERLLADAQQILEKKPSPELEADVFLAYSTLSELIFKHDLGVYYAERGLAALSGNQGLSMQVRLLRNLARSKSGLGELDAAKETLQKAKTMAERVDDPKLTTDLLLESARLARMQSDYSVQDEQARQVLLIAEKLGNRQMAGRAYEAIGLARKDQERYAESERELSNALSIFNALGLDHDEMRVLRDLLEVKLIRKKTVGELTPLIRRMIALSFAKESNERARAGDDFDARMAYLQQQRDMERLQFESTMAKEREVRLTEASQRANLVSVLWGAMLLVLMVFFIQQRRSNKALRSTLAKLSASQSQTQDLLRLNAGYVFLIDPDGRIQQANPAMATALGTSPLFLEGRMLHEFLSGQGLDAMKEYLLRVIEKGEHESVLEICGAGGRERQWRVVSRLSSQMGRRAYIVGSAVDVTEQLSETESLREKSLRDALTGCFNRHYLDEFESKYSTSQWAVIGVDLNGFKQINDERGHECGDQVLQQVGKFLQDRVRTEDAVVRLGGDEFLVVLAHSDQTQLDLLAARFRQDESEAACGFSIGSALREGNESFASTLARADAAMYSAKRSHYQRAGS